ncbi:MAG: thermonuclease family protein [Desulfatitalea sp.]|nr:thermonuclease family protein [Desulfatitalea sp.]NNK00501.1 thermonuclease family protein [Desulfatitalea sp.]
MAILSLLWLLVLPAAAQPWTAKVVGVADGDTITVLQGTKQTKIRLHGIDCPEKKQDYGQKAKTFTSDACFGKTVRILPKDTDRYGRTVAVVLLDDGRSLNLELLRAGLAWHYRQYSSDSDYAQAEKTAKAGGFGLWQDKNPVPPWDFRKGKRQGQTIRRSPARTCPASK